MNKETEQKTCDILDELMELAGHPFSEEEMEAIADAYAALIALLRI